MPTNFREYQREYMREYRAAGRDSSYGGQRSLTRPFVGCDGEGSTLESGYHAYFMLRVGDETLVARKGSVRLSTRECLGFLSDLDPTNIYVGYFFDYDVTKILEDLPLAKLERLLNRGARTGTNGKLFPIDYEGFQVDYLPRKEFKVRRRLTQTEEGSTWSPWVVINDVGSFFQTSFLAAIKAWKVGNEDDWEAIRIGKEQRANFEVEDFQDIAAYNALEIRLLQILMERFRDACAGAGYIPRRWQGPGLLAEAMFAKHGVPRSRDVPLLNSSPDLVRFATSAYYGGRTEVAAIGPVNQPTFQWDINSAYPFAMLSVPCLLHGEWEYFEGSDIVYRDFNRPAGKIGERFALVYGNFERRDGEYPRTLYYGFPVRTKQGTIIFPERGSGWYWSFEIGAASHQRFHEQKMWVYTRVCSCKPLAFVEDVYATRQSIGKDGPGIVLKLGMNSLYGKTVQSIGAPKYANPIWGSFLTAYPRMMIQDFIHSSPYCADNRCGQDILMIATDSVATITDRVDYEDSKKLGGWSRELHSDGVFIVQPGVYFGSSGKPSKTRGVPRTIVDAYEHVFRDAFATMVETGEMSDGDVSVPQHLFVGIRYAIHRRNLKLLGQWIQFGEDGKEGKTVSFDWTSKRALFPALGPSENRSYILTFPYEGAENIVTLPYSRNIGGLLDAELARLPWEDQPDWAFGMADIL